MKLITENIEEVRYVIQEDKATGKKKSIIEGVFMQAEQKNRNNRIYSKPILENAVKRYSTEQVAKNRAVGELNHPDTPTINLDKVSHRITELRWEGNDVMGKAIILDTPMGRIARGLMEGGVQLGVSSRGMGSIEQRGGISYVKPDFMLATVDIVQDPSCVDAMVDGILEGVEWGRDESGNYYRIQEYKETVKKSYRNSISEEERTNIQIKAFKKLFS
jgi:hypothetical protein